MPILRFGWSRKTNGASGWRRVPRAPMWTCMTPARSNWMGISIGLQVCARRRSISSSPSAAVRCISNLINLQPDETVKAFLAVAGFVPDQFIVMVTRHGVIKKSELTEFDNPMARGIIAVSLDEGDELIGANITNGSNFIFLGSHQGQAIRFAESQVRAMGRTARGVRAMALPEGDFLVGMEVVEKDGLILSIAENGFGKRTKLEVYRLT